MLFRSGGSGIASYSGSAAACTEVIIAAIREAASAGSLDRETVRAAGTDPTALFSSVLGEIGFDAVGDIDTKVVSFYRTDLTIDADPAAAGVGDWVFIEQVDETAAAG